MKPYFDGRKWLKDVYFPAIDGRLLYVGVAEYTVPYYDLIPNPTHFETLDIDPANAKFGSPSQHWTGDFLEFAQKKLYPSFKHIAIYGLDYKYTPVEWPTWEYWALRLLQHADKMLLPGGTLLFGGYVTGEYRALRLCPTIEDYTVKYENDFQEHGKDSVIWWFQKKS